MTQEAVRTVAIRPVDCPTKSINQFIDMVMRGGEVPLANLKRGVPTADMLFFTGLPGEIMGVGALRYANADYHRYLFQQADVPEMYNRDSLEICWLYVDPKYRGKGVWKSARAARLHYLEDRPSHGVHRVKNDLISPLVEPSDYTQAGQSFKDMDDKHLIKLVVRNHDPVYNPAKRMRYR